MSERIRGGYDDALYKSTFTLLFTFSPFASFDHLQSAHSALCVLCLAADQLVTRQSLNLQRCY